MLDAVGCVGCLLHDTDAAARQRNSESAILKPVVLRAKAETAVREEAQSVNGLAESRGIIEVLRQALRAIMIHVERYGVDEVLLDDASLGQRRDHLVAHPHGWHGNVGAHSSRNISQRVLQLSPRPHVPITKEKLGALQVVSCERLLGRHG